MDDLPPTSWMGLWKKLGPPSGWVSLPPAYPSCSADDVAKAVPVSEIEQLVTPGKLKFVDMGIQQFLGLDSKTAHSIEKNIVKNVANVVPGSAPFADLVDLVSPSEEAM
mmetsp:Transcript_103540/g.178416  ORF Transcript_103540/g.178416 Transcript_103540/m.178416 type:complete len:109 (-) Transcript_103540:387-713(-)